MKIERHIFHRKAAKSAEMIDLFFFAAETPAKKNAHASSIPVWKRGRISYIQRAYAKRAVFPFSVVPVPWNVYHVKCGADFSGTKPIPLGSAEKGKN